MKNERLTGNVVAFTSSTVDMYYGVPNLEGAEFIGTETEESSSGKKVQLKFKLKSGEEWTVLFLQSSF